MRSHVCLPGSESLSRSQWQYCMRVFFCILGFFCFVLCFLLSSLERRRRSLPTPTPLITLASCTPRIRPALIPVPKGGGCKVYRSARDGSSAISEPGCSRVTRHKLPHHHAPSQLDHPSCCKSRADLKGCSSLFTQNTFLWLPVACPLHPVSFSLSERQKNYTLTLLSE